MFFNFVFLISKKHIVQIGHRFIGGKHAIMALMKLIVGLWLALLLGGCAVVLPDSAPDSVSDSARHVAVSWAELPGWGDDTHATAIPVFLRGCPKLGGEWTAICAAAKALPADVDDNTARQFFEDYFVPHQLRQEDGGREGLITGYYEPLLAGALSPSARYQYPIYARPEGLLSVELGALYPDLAGRRIRARVVGKKAIPYYSRAEIDGAATPLHGEELLWVDDKVALFFLHIQGSGLVRLPDGRIIGVGYHDQNGHPYRSIGRILIEAGEMTAAEVNLFSLLAWLENNESRADWLLNQNPSYIFFVRRDTVDIGPVGSLGITLTPERSLAVDKSAIPLGAPVWLATVMPNNAKQPLQKLMMAQDTGGAIKGKIRADFFWGRGEHAETMAGLMKTRGSLFVLLPR